MKIKNMTDSQVTNYLNYFNDYYPSKDIIYDEIYGTFKIDSSIFHDTEDIHKTYFA